MIRGLFDEPLTLAAARADLRFPPGLQAPRDSALARNPVTRYQSAAKFANDVASVTGLARGAGSGTIPITREGADNAPPGSAPGRATPRRTSLLRKRAFVPIVVGAAVGCRAGGGAWGGICGCTERQRR